MSNRRVTILDRSRLKIAHVILSVGNCRDQKQVEAEQTQDHEFTFWWLRKDRRR